MSASPTAKLDKARVSPTGAPTDAPSSEAVDACAKSFSLKATVFQIARVLIAHVPAPVERMSTRVRDAVVARTVGKTLSTEVTGSSLAARVLKHLGASSLDTALLLRSSATPDVIEASRFGALAIPA